MLITPIRPKTIARPSAISSRIEESDRPWNAVSIAVVRSAQRSRRRIAAVAASRTGGGWAVSAASSRSRSTPLALPSAPRRAAASARSAGSGARSSMSAIASSNARRTHRSPSVVRAFRSSGNAEASPACPILIAAPFRAAGSGSASWAWPENASISGRRTRRRLRPVDTSCSVARSTVTGLPSAPTRGSRPYAE
jgi:hypothetical protein